MNLILSVINSKGSEPATAGISNIRIPGNDELPHEDDDQYCSNESQSCGFLHGQSSLLGDPVNHAVYPYPIPRFGSSGISVGPRYESSGESYNDDCESGISDAYSLYTAGYDFAEDEDNEFYGEDYEVQE